MKYAMFTLSLPQCSPDEAARLIKDAGYDGVEWRCAEQPSPLPSIPNCWGSNRATLDVKHGQSQAAEFRRISQNHGLEVANLASYCCADDPEAVKRCIEIATALGSPRLRITAPRYDGRTHYNDALRRARDAFATAADLCRDAGVQGLIELHMGNIAPSASLGLRLVEGLDPRHMAIMFDPGNMVFEGHENWKLGCELLGPHLAYCHAKNSRQRPAGLTTEGAIRWEYEACEMHTGFVDWGTVFRALRAVAYDGWISNEDFHLPTGCGLERIKVGLEHLKRCAQSA